MYINRGVNFVYRRGSTCGIISNMTIGVRIMGNVLNYYITYLNGFLWHAAGITSSCVYNMLITMYFKQEKICWAKLLCFLWFSRVLWKFFREYLFILYKLCCLNVRYSKSFPVKNFIGWNL